jgi:hypothetical protein
MLQIPSRRVELVLIEYLDAVLSQQSRGDTAARERGAVESAIVTHQITEQTGADQDFFIGLPPS